MGIVSRRKLCYSQDDMLHNVFRSKVLLGTLVVLSIGLLSLAGWPLSTTQPVPNPLPARVQVASVAAIKSTGNVARREASPQVLPPTQVISSRPSKVASTYLQGSSVSSATATTQPPVEPASTQPPVGPTSTATQSTVQTIVAYPTALATRPALQSATLAALPLTVTATPNTGQPVPTPQPAKPQAAVPVPFGGTPVLPSGARYGERNPNVPGRVVRIAAPSIKLDTKVYEVYAVNGVWEVAEYAAGHNYNSKNPGEGGNVVLAGHNNWKGEVFRYLEFLKPGDEVDLWTQAGKKYVYKVREVLKLKEAGVSYEQRVKNARVMDNTPQEQLTLITCWPYTTFTHRLIVIADPV